MQKYTIVCIENPTELDYLAMCKGINDFANTQGLVAAAGNYFFAVYDENKTMIAAISGFDNFGCMEIGGLWIDEPLRGLGYGKSLVQHAEEWGQKQGCKFATVFTLKEWPAFHWYQKLGFTLEFERKGHANNCTGCYLIKSL